MTYVFDRSHFIYTFEVHKKIITSMAATENRLSTVVGEDGKSQIIVKLTISRNQRPCFKSGVFIKAQYYKPVKETAKGAIYGIVPPKKGKLNFLEVKEITDAKNELNSFTNRLLKICQVIEKENADLVCKEWIEEALRVTVDERIEDITFNTIKTALEEEKKEVEVKAKKKPFFSLMEEYITKNDTSVSKIKNFRVLMRALKRFELFKQMTGNKRKKFKLDIDTATIDTLEDFRDYFRNEADLQSEYESIFKKILAESPAITGTQQKKQKIEQRGSNATVIILKKFRAFWNWAVKQGYTSNYPFGAFNIGSEVYGTPYYITLEERNKIAEFDLSQDKMLETQRDIFIFHCCIGCRVSDLLNMTPANIIDGEIQYIPNKTIEDNPEVAKIPLNNRASMLVEKYKGVDENGKLFPFITAQRYNDYIKEIFTKCGITRMVTILNPLTGKEERKPLNEIASSHLCRRTFVGNLYKQVKDPNLICPMSGHKYGSKAFARYHEVDRDMRNDLVNLLD